MPGPSCGVTLTFKQFWNTVLQLAQWLWQHGPLARYVKLRVAHAPGIPETFSLPLQVSDSDMHHDTCVTHVPWCLPGSLTGGFFWSQWRGKRSRHSRRMRNPQLYESGRRPIKSLQYDSHYLMSDNLVEGVLEMSIPHLLPIDWKGVAWRIAVWDPCYNWVQQYLLSMRSISVHH